MAKKVETGTDSLGNPIMSTIPVNSGLVKVRVPTEGSRGGPSCRPASPSAQGRDGLCAGRPSACVG